MKTMPLTVGTIHLIGIGGIGMSGIAEILHNLGYAVQGSVHIGHKGQNVENAAVVVVSSAIKGENPEVAAARARLIPVVRRAEMLAELMRLKASIAIAGTHGKTTTTSLVAALLDAAGMDPTVINGGIINAYGTNAVLGEGDWMVVEADESDGTFIKLPATIAIVTNIDPEHLDYYGDFETLKKAFRTFVENIPFYGFAALCIDHPEVQALIPKVTDRKIITYGHSPQADVRAANLEQGPNGMTFDIILTDRQSGAETVLENLSLPMYGAHNAQNACAAVAVGLELGMEEAQLRRGLAGFGGVKRRFTRTGEAGGVTVIDDYGHHPVEIAAVLKAARGATRGNVIAVVQPHRYSRLSSLFEEFCTCFNDADQVIVADVYAAGESPIPGIDRDALAKGLRAHGHRNVLTLSGPDDLARLVAENAQDGDMVVCLGAGNITTWAHALPGQLAALIGGGRA